MITAQKRGFKLRISSVNVTKSTVSFGFGEEIFNRNLHFLCSASRNICSSISKLEVISKAYNETD